MFTRIDNVKINYNFNDGIYVHVDGPDNFYYVEVREYPKYSDQSKLIQGHHVTSKNLLSHKTFFHHETKFYFDFEILIYKFDLSFGLTLIWNHRYNDRDRLVKFILKSDSEEESSIWASKVLKYSKIKGCRPIIESSFDEIKKLSSTYFAIDGVETYKTFTIGRLPKSSQDWKTIDDRFKGFIFFGNWKSFWSYEHPRSWNFLNSHEIVDDILGL